MQVVKILFQSIVFEINKEPNPVRQWLFISNEINTYTRQILRQSNFGIISMVYFRSLKLYTANIISHLVIICFEI